MKRLFGTALVGFAAIASAEESKKAEDTAGATAWGLPVPAEWQTGLGPESEFSIKAADAFSWLLKPWVVAMEAGSAESIQEATKSFIQLLVHKTQATVANGNCGFQPQTVIFDGRFDHPITCEEKCATESRECESPSQLLLDTRREACECTAKMEYGMLGISDSHDPKLPQGCYLTTNNLGGVVTVVYNYNKNAAIGCKAKVSAGADMPKLCTCTVHQF